MFKCAQMSLDLSCGACCKHFILHTQYSNISDRFGTESHPKLLPPSAHPPFVFLWGFCCYSNHGLFCCIWVCSPKGIRRLCSANSTVCFLLQMKIQKLDMHCECYIYIRVALGISRKAVPTGTLKSRRFTVSLWCLDSVLSVSCHCICHPFWPCTFYMKM